MHPLASSASRDSLSLFLDIQKQALEGDVEGCLVMGCRMWSDALGMDRAWAGLIGETGEELVEVMNVSLEDEEKLVGFTPQLEYAPASLMALSERRAVFLSDPQEWGVVTRLPIMIAPAFGPALPKAVLVGEWKSEEPPGQDQLDLATLLAQEVGFSTSAARRLSERAAAAAALEERVRGLENRVTTGDRARRLAEEASQLLKRANNRIHLMMEQLPEGLAVLTVPDGSVLLSNKAALQVLSPDREGKIRATFLRADGSPYPASESPLSHVMRGASFGPERVLIAGPGKARSATIMSAVPVIVPGGRPGEALVVLREVTSADDGVVLAQVGRGSESKDQAAAVRLPGDLGQQQLLKQLTEFAPVGVAVIVGPEYRLELGNSYFSQTTISPGIPVVNRALADIFPPTVAVEIVAIVDEVYREGQRISIREQALRPGDDRDPVYCDAEYVPLFAPGGQVEKVLILCSDVSERVLSRRQVEELLGLANRRTAELTNILDNLTDAVFICDSKGFITIINEAGRHMLGVSKLDSGNGKGMPIRKTLRTRHLDGSVVAYDEQPLIRALKGERLVLEDAIIYSHHAGKEIQVRTSAAPIRDEGGWIIGAVAVIRDISALAELDHLKDHFVTMAAHELKTPVAVIKGYSQLMLRAADRVPPDLVRMLETINRGATRIDGVIGEILKLPELQRNRAAPATDEIDLSEVVEIAVLRVQTRASEHTIRAWTPGPVFCRADRFRVEQVLENLLENATKYSPDGGIVEVTVETRGDQAVVSVRDRGIGIPAHRQKRLFERFYSAHSGTRHDYGGIGLGLHLSRKIIATYGGDMWFESEEGKGSCFHFSLPLSRKDG